MSYRPSELRLAFVISLSVFLCILSGCGSSSSSSGTASLRIYEMIAPEGSFTAVDGDSTGTSFRLSLSNVPRDILYFTNRGAQEAGYDSVYNVMRNLWPTVAPTAVIKVTTAEGDIQLFCTLDSPVYKRDTNELSFTITYLDGRRPDPDLAFTNFKMIMLNNAQEAETAVWSYLLAGDVGMFESTTTPGTYTFSIQKTIGDVAGFTSAPKHKSSTSAIKDYIESWNNRFGSSPPNTSIAYDAQGDLPGAVQVVVLSDPLFDENTGSLRFTAKFLYGTSPIGDTLTVQNPSLLIDGGPGEDFPAYDDNVFSIQFRNSTKDAITVWLTGDQPPCSKTEVLGAQGATGSCITEAGNPDDYAAKWKALVANGVFERSGTKFYIIRTNDKQDQIDVSNSVNLEKGEVLRIVPPIVNGAPEWWYNRSTSGPQTAGTNSWVTKKGTKKPSPPQRGLLFEHNVQGEFYVNGKKQPDIVNFDVSGVNGVHVKATMHFEGKGCEGTNCNCSSDPQKKVLIPLEAYNGTNDGCPYIMTIDSLVTCPNPKLYPYDSIGTGKKPDWVVAARNFSLDNVPKYPDIQKGAITDLNKYIDDFKIPPATHYVKDTLTGFILADAAAGVDQQSKPYRNLKSAYHIWWRTNPVAVGWLNYLQHNKFGRGDLYGWAYDEMKWRPDDTFNNDGNPVNKKTGKVDDNLIAPDINCPSKPKAGTKQGKYLNIDILYVM